MFFSHYIPVVAILKQAAISVSRSTKVRVAVSHSHPYAAL